MRPTVERSFALYISLSALTFCLGLLSRRWAALPEYIVLYGGDTLWALFVFWLFCLLLKQRRSGEIALWALAFSFLIEFSQLYQAPWINQLRHTTVGGLILGYGFKVSDLVCYSCGICVGIAIDRKLSAPDAEAQ